MAVKEVLTIAGAIEHWNAQSERKHADNVALCEKNGHADPLFDARGAGFCPRCVTWISPAPTAAEE